VGLPELGPLSEVEPRTNRVPKMEGSSSEP
jgi:hypothetical protein